MKTDPEWEQKRVWMENKLLHAKKVAMQFDPRMGAWASQCAPFHKLTEADCRMIASFVASVEQGMVKPGDESQEPVLDIFVRTPF